MEVDAMQVIQELSQQVGQQAVEIATLKVANATLQRLVAASAEQAQVQAVADNMHAAAEVTD